MAIGDHDQLGRLLTGLPRQQRAAVVLRYYLDLADDQIAAELGCSPVTVRSYISRGLAAMRISGADDDSGPSGAKAVPQRTVRGASRGKESG